MGGEKGEEERSYVTHPNSSDIFIRSFYLAVTWIYGFVYVIRHEVSIVCPWDQMICSAAQFGYSTSVCFGMKG